MLIKKVDLEGVGFSIGGEADLLDVRLRNVSDAPSLVADVLSVSVQARSDKLALRLTGPVAGADRPGLDFSYKPVPVGRVFVQLPVHGRPPAGGGTIDLTAQGALTGLGDVLAIDLPLAVQLRDTTFALAGAKPTEVPSLALPIGLSGPLTRPAVAFDDTTLQRALLDAGQRELAAFVQSQAGNLLGGELPVDLTRPPGEIVDEAARKLEAEKQRLEEEAKQRAAEEAKKLLPGGLKGLLPGGGEPKKKGGGGN